MSEITKKNGILWSEKIKSCLKDEWPSFKEIIPLSLQASGRVYFRLRKENDESMVLCFDETLCDEKHSFLLQSSFFQEQGVYTPQLLKIDFKNHFYLQEDLGDESLLVKSFLAKDEKEVDVFYKNVIDEMMKWQKIRKKGGEFSFSEEKFNEEIEKSIEFFYQNFLKVKDSGHLREIKNFFAPLNKKLSNESTYYTHRDFHSRNIFFKEERPYIIDYQDARFGPLSYDLVSLLEDSYFDLNKEQKEDYKNYFSCKMQISQDELDLSYRECFLQRIVKVLGTFSFLGMREEKRFYLQYIAFNAEKLRHFLSNKKEDKELKELLLRPYYGL